VVVTGVVIRLTGCSDCLLVDVVVAGVVARFIWL